METTTNNTHENEFTGSATYCPEDNKLRLYIGRVPRPEFEKLRAEGWKTLHKQREAGGGDFVATWTPERHATALSYAGIIEDEDMGPAERAADRAERFGEYREKRLGEATVRADRFLSQSMAHGFQSEDRAERAAARHDRIADRACDAWSKAEYWQRRTTGVISHALHVSSPSVRMGRIKDLEADIRRIEISRSEYNERRELWVACSQLTDEAKRNAIAHKLAYVDSGGSIYTHPRTGKKSYLFDHVDPERCADPLNGADLCALWLSLHGPLREEGPWLTHYRLRLAYENQMLEAQGGRAGVVEMVPGGWLRGGRRLSAEERQIVKVNKSPASGRVVSVLVRDNRPSFRNHYGNPFPDGVARVLSHTVEVERMPPDAYRAPTAEELAAFEAGRKAAKAAAPKKDPCPLINPTDKDAERLVALWNERRRADFDQRHGSNAKYYKFELCEIRRMPQAFYSANSKGSYAKAETRELCSLARLAERNQFYDYSGQAERAAARGPKLCSIRTTGFDPVHVVILTDKPQKDLPAAVWAPYVAPVAPVVDAPFVEAVEEAAAA